MQLQHDSCSSRPRPLGSAEWYYSEWWMICIGGTTTATNVENVVIYSSYFSGNAFARTGNLTLPHFIRARPEALFLLIPDHLANLLQRVAEEVSGKRLADYQAALKKYRPFLSWTVSSPKISIWVWNRKSKSRAGNEGSSCISVTNI